MRPAARGAGALPAPRPAHLGVERGTRAAAARRSGATRARARARSCSATRCSPTGARGRKGATARVRAYYDVLPDRESRVTLDAGATNRFGDPMPRVAFRDAPESAALRAWQEESHPRPVPHDGARRRRRDPAHGEQRQRPRAGASRAAAAAWATTRRRASWTGWGRAHDHENLWVAGAPGARERELLQRHAHLRGRRAPHRRRDRR